MAAVFKIGQVMRLTCMGAVPSYDLGTHSAWQGSARSRCMSSRACEIPKPEPDRERRHLPIGGQPSAAAAS